MADVVAGLQNVDGGRGRVPALAGVAAETGVVYLDNAAKEVRERCRLQGSPYTRPDLYEAVMIGGMVSSTLLTLIVIPAVYALVKGWRLPINMGAL